MKTTIVPQAMKIPDATAAVDKEWDKLKNLPAWRESKVTSHEEFVEQAQKEGRRINFCEDAARIHVTLPHLCDPC